MSIDISLMINTGKEDVEVIDVGNYTHNCQPMWGLALESAGLKPADLVSERYRQRQYVSLCSLHQMTAIHALPYLIRAVAHMDDAANESTYTALNPENGWGEFKSAREYLRKLLNACRDNPLCWISTGC